MRDHFHGRNLKKITIATAVVLLTVLAYFNGERLASLVESSKQSFNYNLEAPQPAADAKENACLLMLCQDNEVEKILRAVRSYEDRFNRHHQYDWVVINHKSFPNQFKDAVKNLASGNVTFGVIPKSMWDAPQSLNRTIVNDHMKFLKSKKYGQKWFDWSFRQMNRFYTGFFPNMQELKEYKYYWRVDPDSRLLCDVKTDVFKKMREDEIKYGFLLSGKNDDYVSQYVYENATQFFKQNPSFVNPNAGSSFMNSNSTNYNLCTMFTTSVLGDLDFLRSTEFQEYFKFMDAAGGFFYNRWSDAAVISAAVSNLLDRKQVHWFEEVGYIHDKNDYHVPQNYLNRGLRCLRQDDNSMDWKPHSCLNIANDAFQLGVTRNTPTKPK